VNQKQGILGMRFERFFEPKISAASLALTKEILGQKSAKDHRLKNLILIHDGYKLQKSEHFLITPLGSNCV
jgi:hypothetical protein